MGVITSTMNTTQPSFDTVIETLHWLQAEGFTHDFNLDYDSIKYNNGTGTMSPDDFHIEWIFRFEGETDPGDEEIVYGISSPTHNIKGVLLSAYGMYADPVSEQMIKKLSVH
jgi:hypothetical protein